MIANLMPEDLFFVWQAVKSCPPPFRALPLSQRNIDENLFVSLSSPSSSRYDSVADLGSPETAAARILDQYLTQEFMSTRIGIRREGKVGHRGAFGGGVGFALCGGGHITGVCAIRRER